ncbi:MAG: ExeA family protein [Candidatus Omnitrophota bacterium]
MTLDTLTESIEKPAEVLLDSFQGTDRFVTLFHEFFGFKENPFANTPDPSFFYLSPRHKEALTNLAFGVRQRRGFIVITGEVGSGKTTLCRYFLRFLPPEMKTAVVLNPMISSSHLLASIAADFGIPEPGRSKRVIYRSLLKFLLEGIERQQNACLVIDEAQCLSRDLLEEIRLLSNLETSKQKLLQIVLMGQPEFQGRLRQTGLRQLRERISIYMHLDGLGMEEVGPYIRHRLEMGSVGPVTVRFQEEVIEKIARMSRGIPRLINTICDRILMAAFAAGEREISMALAAGAFQEMNFICGGEKKPREERPT